MLEIRDLTAKHRHNTVLENISFKLRPHRFTALLGRNGAGKSTLVSCINQQIPYLGQITFSERSLSVMASRERAVCVSVLPQILLSPPFTVEELVSFGRNPYLDFTGRLQDADRKKVNEALRLTGADSFRGKRADCISGGERQLAYLSMTLAQDARVMVLDEPTTFMDMERENFFFRLLTEIKSSKKKTLLVAMHNLNLAAKYADDVIVLDGKTVRFFGTKEDCLKSKTIESVFSVNSHVLENGEIVFSAE